MFKPMGLQGYYNTHKNTLIGHHWKMTVNYSLFLKLANRGNDSNIYSIFPMWIVLLDNQMVDVFDYLYFT